MARIDRLKEEIGWLKIVFAALVAIDASLIGWLAQNYSSARWSVVLVGVAGSVTVTIGIAHVNHVIYARIQELEDV